MIMFTAENTRLLLFLAGNLLNLLEMSLTLKFKSNKSLELNFKMRDHRFR